MARQMKAEAIISAVDATGGVFDKVAGKIRKLNEAARSAGGAHGVAMAAQRVDSSVHKFAGALAAGYGAHKFAGLAEGVAETYEKFDDLVRYQRAILSLTPERQKPYIDQAIHAGATSRYNDLQVIQAQLDLAQRGVDEKLIRPIVETAIQYGQAMNAELPEAAKTIEGILFSTNKHLEDANAALKVAQRTVNMAVKLAKIGGLDDEDIRQAFKYAGLAGSTAGLSDETIGTMLALMRRSNVRGDEGGVAVRAVAGRLVAPTNKGMDALAAMGIDYNKFTRMPGGLSADSFGRFMASRFGQVMSGHMAERVRAIFSDPDIVGNSSDFVTKTFEAVGPLFGKTKHGKMAAKDSDKLTKAIKAFYKISTESVDSEGLLRAIIGAHPSLAQVNAMFGERQGARIMAFMRDLDKFNEFWQRLHDAPDDFAKKIGDERMGGFSGAKTRAAGSYKNVETAIGRAWDPELTSFFDWIARLEQHFAELDAESIRAVTGLGALSVGLVGVGTALKTLEAWSVPFVGALATLLARMTALGLPLLLGSDTNRPAEQYGALARMGFTPDEIKSSDFPPIGSANGQLKAVRPPLTMDAVRGALGYPIAKSTAGGRGLPGYPVANPTEVVGGALGHPVAEVKGDAKLDVAVKIEPSDSFVSSIISAIKNEINVFGGGTAGSTGRSMPEAGPEPGGVSGW